MIRSSLISISRTLLLVVCTAGIAPAQVQLDRLFPPAAAIGGETSIKAEGKFPNWPVEVACDRDDVTINMAEDSGSFRVVVPADAAPGVAWIRLFDAASASKLVPILIEPVAPQEESEPNNQVAEAATVDLPAVVAGRLQKSGDVDSFRIALKTGQTLVVSTIAQRLLRSPMDAVLQLVDLNGNVLVQSDDVRGIDPQLVYQVQNDTELLVRLFAFPETPNSTIGFAGSASFIYALRMTTGSFVDHVLPLVADSDSAASSRPYGWNLPPKTMIKRHAPTGISPAVAYVPGALGWQWQIPAPLGAALTTELSPAAEPPLADHLPLVHSGHIGQPGEIDRVRLLVEKDKKYRASVQSREFGFHVDSVLRVVDTEKGGELARNDDRARNQYDAVIDYSAAQDGEIELQISDLVDGFGPRHAYSVRIEEAKPSVQLTFAEDRFLVKAGESVEIPISISRLQGFGSKLRIAVEGLPEGVQFEAVESESKGDSSKSVKLKLTAGTEAAGHQGPLRIIGHVLDEQGQPTSEFVTAYYQLRDVVRLSHAWLTVSPKS